MRVLGIETSCDETSVACVDDAGVRSNLISSQVDLHQHFGGVVPELASRAHLTNLLPVCEAALASASWRLDDVEAVAATAGPGLLGSVLMGLCFGKSIAHARQLPFVGVHHIEGHILANEIERPMQLPALVLVVSGGHTQLIRMRAIGNYERIGTTRDDAAGETFDKAAKLMGLPYPGGPEIQRLAESGRPGRFTLPRALRERGNLDFSFSGVKTALRLQLERLGEPAEAQQLADLAFELEAAIVDALIGKCAAALEQTAGQPYRGLYLAGGVAANRRLRQAAQALADRRGLDFAPPPLRYCTDNAAMIAWAGRRRLQLRGPDGLDLPGFARDSLRSWPAPSPSFH